LVIRAILAVFVLGTAPAAASDCRLALVLALDVSSSVDANEDALQRGGLAAALIAPEIQRAFFSAPQPVALAVYEWSGRYNQKLLLDWQLIDSPAHLLDVATIIGRSTRGQDDFPTSMGYALGYGAGVLDRGPKCLFRTLDMAGDGENNDGFGPSRAYVEFPFAEVTVNGLVVNGAEFEAEVDLIDYYTNQVLHGPGAFLEVAQGFDDYERAMRRKLERELSVMTLGNLITSTVGHPG
jgi:hypothetical protein